MKYNNKNKGITLIALVITIVVMLILVAVTISMAVNGGLFEYAGKAVGDTQNAINAEQDLGSGKVTIGNTTYNSIDEYLGTSGGKGTGDTILPYDQTEKENGLLKANATYTTTENGKTYTAIVPKGFAIVPGLDGTTTIAKGLVITDKVDGDGNSTGNEFVWIPVTYTAENADSDSNGYDDGFDSVFYRSDWSSNARGATKYTDTSGSSYNEPLSSGGYTNEQAEYNDMLKSVYDNGGFYIGRYEAGIKTTESARIATTTGESNMVVQRDCYPYTYVGWGNAMNDYTSDVMFNTSSYSQTNGNNFGKGALLLSKELYGKKEDAGKYGVTSTLCYGIQWDAMLDFIKAEKNVTSSKDWGNYADNLWTIDRKTARYTTSPSSDTTWNLIDDETNDKKEKTSSSGIILTTGASDDFSAKNIFDVAGNVYEWTNEAGSSGFRVNRGGSYSIGGSSYPASYRYSNDPYFCYYYVGFRPALYVK